jgi:hypothetical protein
MLRTKLGAVALAAVLPLTAAVTTVAATSADAVAATSAITAKPSDSTPAAGKEFTVSGTFTVNGKPAAGHVVRVQSKTGGTWQGITGARVTTNSIGAYKVRLILSVTGKRQLRVVGVGTGSQPNAYRQFTVTVH